MEMEKQGPSFTSECVVFTFAVSRPDRKLFIWFEEPKEYIFSLPVVYRQIFQGVLLVYELAATFICPYSGLFRSCIRTMLLHVT